MGVQGAEGVEMSRRERMKCFRRISIEEDFETEAKAIPEIPQGGIRIKVCYAGATYSEKQVQNSSHPHRPRLSGVYDTSLFPGYEVSGLVDEICSSLKNSGFNEGDRVIVYPFLEDVPEVGYDEYIVVKNPDSLIKVPNSVDLRIAALLPCGALRAYAAILKAKPYVLDRLEHTNELTNILIVGSGGLALWTLRMAKNFIAENASKVRIIVAGHDVEKLDAAREIGCYDVVHWDEEVHEQYICSRTLNACEGGVHVAIDFVSSGRSTKRCLKVLNNEGLLVVGGNSKYEVTFNLNTLAQRNQSVLGVSKGSRQQLMELVEFCAQGKLQPPKFTVYPVEEANDVFRQLSECKISGRAILEVCPEDDEAI
jgi:D-arabinose 1-dehydrogenase-like Zn-dependent alcohol dehydrogenase